MKILHVCKKFPGAIGGDAVVVSNLRSQQQAAGHTVAVVTSNCDEIPNAPRIYKFGFKDTPANLDMITPKRLISLAALFFKIFIVLRKERPDVIHTHSVDMAFIVSAAARFYRIPIVHTFHIVTFYDSEQPTFRRKVELWLARKAKPRVATVPNNYDVKKLRHAGMDQTVLLPNGVDLPFWRTPAPTDKSQDFVFLTVGRLERQKGYEYLIKAVSQLAQSPLAGFRVIIAGTGSRESILRELIRLYGVEDIVTLAGRKSPEEIRALFAQADAAVFPSLYETTPVTVLEAWAAGVPVIVSSVGILRDAPADFSAAYVVPPRDEAALAEAMGRCMTDAQARQSVAESGYEEAGKYGWPAIAQTAESIYKGVVQ